MEATAELEGRLNGFLSNGSSPDALRELVVYWVGNASETPIETDEGSIHREAGDSTRMGIVVERTGGDVFAVCNHEGIILENHGLASPGHRVDYTQGDTRLIQASRSHRLPPVRANWRILQEQHIIKLRQTDGLVLSRPAALLARVCRNIGYVPDYGPLRSEIGENWNEGIPEAEVQREILQALYPADPEPPSIDESNLMHLDERAETIIGFLWENRRSDRPAWWTFEEILDECGDVSADFEEEFRTQFVLNGEAGAYMKSWMHKFGGGEDDWFTVIYDAEEGYAVVPHSMVPSPPA